MQPFFQDYLYRLTDLHQDILNAIQGLPVQSSAGTPIQQSVTEMNAINVLVGHIQITQQILGYPHPAPSSRQSAPNSQTLHEN